MRHRKFTFKIGRTQAHRRALLANAVCSLIIEQRIVTTVTRAKQIRRLADKMITLGKRGTLHARRRAIAILHRPVVVAQLFNEIAPRYQDRHGGYTRIMRLNRRTGDGAEVCVLELVAEQVATAPTAGQAETGSAAAETAAAGNESVDAATAGMDAGDDAATAATEAANDGEEAAKEN